MYYYKKEDQDAAARAYIKAYRDAAALYPKIKKVIQSFDKKVFNKRLETALQEGTGARVFVENRPNLIDIHVYGPHSNWITLATLSKDDFIDGKRIDAGKLIESLTNHRNTLLQTAARYEKQIEEIDQIKIQIKQIKKLLNDVLEPYDYTMRDIYGINAKLY